MSFCLTIYLLILLSAFVWLYADSCSAEASRHSPIHDPYWRTADPWQTTTTDEAVQSAAYHWSTTERCRIKWHGLREQNRWDMFSACRPYISLQYTCTNCECITFNGEWETFADRFRLVSLLLYEFIKNLVSFFVSILIIFHETSHLECENCNVLFTDFERIKRSDFQITPHHEIELHY